MTEKLSRRRMIGITVGSAALAGCLGEGESSDPDDNSSGSELPDNESGDGTGLEEEMDDNDSEQDGDTVAEEDTEGNETGDDAAAEPQASVVTVGPEERPTMFEPETLTVESGTTVTFEWATDTHNIAVESQPDDGNWDGHEEIEESGYTHEYTFDAEGEYEYICEPHAPDMRGVVVVEGGGAGDPENGTEDPTDGTDDPENGSDADGTL